MASQCSLLKNSGLLLEEACERGFKDRSEIKGDEHRLAIFEKRKPESTSDNILMKNFKKANEYFAEIMEIG